ncbi:DUF1631 family protein [Luteimonas sp. MHLX1A]|uniref:DUF1631 family protein n=1 Tax=Alterluteimonas muca TaxID=2878684 RepID=UPI001E3AF8BD|nr:DUF1631 family protein [Luteimonas sp. MHLX1A]MCD9047626.1 DUF1631 domain-containing protein [Luteimonas sp. MHLX1A]
MGRDGNMDTTAAAPPRVFDDLRRGMCTRLAPLLAEAIAAARRECDGLALQDPPPPGLLEDRTDLLLLTRQSTSYERRWQERFLQGTQGWPHTDGAPAQGDAYALVSDDELQAQLIGEPVIGALERRHADILDTIDRRLYSLAACLGSQSRPGNPFAPRALVQAYLGAVTVHDCNPRVRAAVLRHYERQAGDRLGDLYTWLNSELADAGYAMASGSEEAMLLGSVGIATGRDTVWSQGNALAPRASTWRPQAGQPAAPRRTPADAVRGNLLRERVRRARPADGAREMRAEELLALLSLLQAEPDALLAVRGQPSIGRVLRDCLSQVGERIGIQHGTAVPAQVQDDTIELLGRLFDELASSHALGPAALDRLARLTLPFLRLALEDAYLFDEAPGHPALQVLARLVECWDANPCELPAEQELHTLADQVAQAIIDEYHGNNGLFEQLLRRMDQAIEPLQRRAELAEKRVWQAIRGRERLAAARRDADARLHVLLMRGPLLPSVGEFLAEPWRQLLVQTWLRDGVDSVRYRDAVALGEAMQRLDADARSGVGRAVADGLIAIEPALRDCCAACGLDADAATRLLSGLVADLAQPDAPRTPQAMTPLAPEGDGFDPVTHGVSPGIEPLAVGQRVVDQRPGVAPRMLRLAWRSPISSASLLVNLQGARERLCTAAELAGAIARGELLPRPLPGPVDAALRRLEQGAP